MADSMIEIERIGPIARVWMNRAEVHNALNEKMIAELTQAFEDLSRDAAVRVVVLSGRGKSFSAGGDVEWMKRLGAAPFDENVRDAQRLAKMFAAIANCAKPTIVRVNGAALGGGFGLVCCCDIAVASNNAVFATSEVRLGLIPATIGPYVVRAIGERWARRLFQTAERIDAAQAEKIGLVHETVEAEKLDEAVDSVVKNLLLGAPGAQSAAKELLSVVAGRAIDAEMMDETARRIARMRAQDEAREGLSAFLEKRAAKWTAQ
jgi:methylglutaconyl-CoA hydratase